jgi:hypothetical protein
MIDMVETSIHEFLDSRNLISDSRKLAAAGGDGRQVQRSWKGSVKENG